VIEHALRRRTREIARAQAEGIVTPALPADELLALVGSIAATWAVASPERNPRGKVSARTLSRRRAAVIEATKRLVSQEE
jgi:Tetracyclin repressor-like, C-terminal domain